MSIGRAGAAVALRGLEIVGFLSCTVEWEIIAIKIFSSTTLTDENLAHEMFYVYNTYMYVYPV